MPYITPAYITQRYLSQLDDSHDQTLETMIDNAESLVNLYLGFAFAEYGAVPAAVTLPIYAGDRIYLPAHKADSVTTVVYNGNTIDPTTYAAEPGDRYGDAEVNRVLYRRAGWYRGRYAVTGLWGAGPVPASIQQVVAELVVNNWRSKDAGRFTNVVGVEGANAVGYERALTPQQRLTLDLVRRRYQGGIRV